MPTKSVLLDTNGWLALLNRVDDLHATSKEAWKTLGQSGCVIVATDWIVAETGNGLARSVGRNHFAKAVEVLRTSPRGRLIFVTDQLLHRSISLYQSRPDKTWGLVDGASFLVMQGENIVEAFTNDRHFEQAGFQCLLS